VTYFFIVIIFIFLVAVVLFTVRRIRLARHRGKRLPQKNLYYAMVAKLFMKDLPD